MRSARCEKSENEPIHVDTFAESQSNLGKRQQEAFHDTPHLGLFGVRVRRSPHDLSSLHAYERSVATFAVGARWVHVEIGEGRTRELELLDATDS